MIKYRIDYKDPKVIEETQALIDKAQKGDTRAENSLVNLYSEYVEFMVAKYSKKTLIKDDDDLRSAIYRGFIEGIRRYNKDHKTQFIYFTHNWMKKMIFIEAEQNFRTIRLPVNQILFKSNFEAKYSVEYDKQGSIISDDDYQIFIDDDYPNYIAIKETDTHLFSDLIGQDDSEHHLIDSINNCEPAADLIEFRRRLKQNIEKVMKKFLPSEQEVVAKSFGIGEYVQMTSDDIATSMGTTKSNIINIRARVIRLLRHRIFMNILLKDI